MSAKSNIIELSEEFMVMWEEEQPRRCSVKKAFLEISRNLQENACATGSFFNKFFLSFSNWPREMAWQNV